MTLRNDIAITPELVASHGLKPDEYQKILDLIGREPTYTELGIFSAMWNEHCSYKSSKKWLRTLPTKGPRVIQGPGENAGAVDIGDGLCAVFKMESHNHPSFIEPYQGAATGVGGILRDIFTMGASGKTAAKLAPRRSAGNTRPPCTLPRKTGVCVTAIRSASTLANRMISPATSGKLTVSVSAVLKAPMVAKVKIPWPVPGCSQAASFAAHAASKIRPSP